MPNDKSCNPENGNGQNPAVNGGGRSKFVRILLFIETVAVFAVFFLHGAWPIPDSNEAHYISKAIHFWNPDWIPNDPFLESKDSHWFFYLTFGWTSTFLGPVAMGWTGRVIAWGLTGWAWRRLSRALIPIPWVSVLTAAGFVYFIDAFQMAGEWVIGGVEGKSFAFPFVFFGLESAVRGRWNRAWIFFGFGASFHVLVGGWAVICAAFSWFLQARADRPKFLAMLPGLIVGGLLSLPGLIPVLFLDRGASPEQLDTAHQIYVFERLPHHLLPQSFRTSMLCRFFVMTTVWILFCRVGKNTSPSENPASFRILNGFIFGTLFLCLIGLIVGFGLQNDRSLTAAILRFYWFRMSDFAVPLGVSLGSAAMLFRHGASFRKLLTSDSRPIFPVFLGCFAAGFAAFMFANYFVYDYGIINWGEKFRLDLYEPGIPRGIAVIICGAGLWLLFLRMRKKDGPVMRRFATVGITLFYATISICGPFAHMLEYGTIRTEPAESRIDPPGGTNDWKEICRWIENSDIPKDAKFLTPKDFATFKWYAKRPTVGTWKDVPQDAVSLIEWYDTMKVFYLTLDEAGNPSWKEPVQAVLKARSKNEIKYLCETYEVEYLVSHRFPRLDYPIAHENEWFVIYRIGERPEKSTRASD